MASPRPNPEEQITEGISAMFNDAIYPNDQSGFTAAEISQNIVGVCRVLSRTLIEIADINLSKQHGYSADRLLGVPYCTARITESMPQGHAGYLGQKDFDNIATLNRQALDVMGTFVNAHGILANIGQTGTVGAAIRNVVYAAQERHDIVSYDMLVDSLENIRASSFGGDEPTKVTQKGILIHNATKSAWITVLEWKGRTNKERPFVEKQICDFLGRPSNDYRPPSVETLEKAEPPTGLTCEEAIHRARTFHDQALGAVRSFGTQPRTYAATRTAQYIYS